MAKTYHLKVEDVSFIIYCNFVVIFLYCGRIWIDRIIILVLFIILLKDDLIEIKKNSINKGNTKF